MLCSQRAQYLMSRGRREEALADFRAAHATCKGLSGETHPQCLVMLNSMGEWS